MEKFRKKPVVIEATQWDESRHETARRYIHEREHQPSSGPHQSAATDEGATNGA